MGDSIKLMQLNTVATIVVIYTKVSLKMSSIAVIFGKNDRCNGGFRIIGLDQLLYKGKIQCLVMCIV